jgi:hypothetical protein
MRLELSAIAKKGAREAKKTILKRGYPVVFARNNKIYYELPNGEITNKIPKEYKGLI